MHNNISIRCILNIDMAFNIIFMNIWISMRISIRISPGTSTCIGKNVLSWTSAFVSELFKCVRDGIHVQARIIKHRARLFIMKVISSSIHVGQFGGLFGSCSRF